jgi:hypothetical protein
VIRHALAHAKAQELAQPQAVGTTTFQATLAVIAFKVPDQQHAKMAPAAGDVRPRRGAYFEATRSSTNLPKSAAISTACSLS